MQVFQLRKIKRRPIALRQLYTIQVVVQVLSKSQITSLFNTCARTLDPTNQISIVGAQKLVQHTTTAVPCAVS